MKKSMDKVNKALIIVVLILVLFLIGNMFINLPIIAWNKVDEGSLTIDNDIKQANGIIALDGEWEFYKDELLSYNQKTEKRPILVTVPGAWNNQIKYSNMESKFGYGTYRLDVKLTHTDNKMMGLYVQCIPCAYKVFINEELVGQNGIIGDSLETEKADIRPNVLFFTAPSDEFVITMQVSNYHFAKGGFWTSMYLGSLNNIQEFNQVKTIKDMFLIGVIFAVGVIYLFLYLSKYKLKQQLYFSLLCLLAILLIDFDDNMLIYKSLSNMSFETMVRFWYIPSSLIPFLVVLYVVNLFKSLKYKEIINILALLTAINIIVDLLAPAWMSTGLSHISNIISAGSLMFALFVVFVSIKDYKKTAILYLVSFSIILISFIYDYMFYYTNVYNLNIGATITYAIVITVMLQAYILAVDFEDIFKQREQAIKQAAQSELAFLQAQIKPHFLYNALSAIEDVCYKDSKRAGELITDLTLYLQNSFEFGNLERFVTLKKELQFINNYIHIQKERFGDRMNYEEHIDIPLSTRIPILVLEPLVENAVHHGISKKVGDGTVRLTAQYIQDGIRYQIEDNGVGMDEKFMVHLFDENAERKGVGLKNIQKRLRSLYRDSISLNIESETNVGTRVWFVLPMKEGENP
ncbi:MAG: histidine kinase [Eubacteriales bacterium]